MVVSALSLDYNPHPYHLNSILETIITVQPTTDLDFSMPIYERLREQGSGLRTSSDGSLLVHSLIDLCLCFLPPLNNKHRLKCSLYFNKASIEYWRSLKRLVFTSTSFFALVSIIRSRFIVSRSALRTRARYSTQTKHEYNTQFAHCFW